MCSQEDRVPVAQLLLRGGAEADPRTKSNYTPLHVACHHGHVNMVRLLIEQGAEVNPVTNAGYTPLHQAAQQGHVLVINLLLKNKADPNAVTQVNIKSSVLFFFWRSNRRILLERTNCIGNCQQIGLH